MTDPAAALKAAVPAKGSFAVSLGAFIRGQVRREIERAAWDAGLNIDTEESKGFFESVYRFTVRGPSATVTAYMNSVEQWIKEEIEDHAR